MISEFKEVRFSHGMDSFKIMGSDRFLRASFSEISMEVRIESIKENPGMVIRFRAYDDGIAFRYEVPAARTDTISIWEELTAFRFSDNPSCWYLQEPNQDFEGPYSVSSLGAISVDSLLHLPMTFQFSSGLTGVIAEADLDSYGGLRLRKHTFGDSLTLFSDIAKRKGHAPAVSVAGPLISPWRVILLEERPADLLTNNLINYLNKPSPPQDFSWVKPGRAMWTWYSHGTQMKDADLGFTGMDTKSILKYVDYASQADCLYFLIDAGWAKGQEHDTLAPSYHQVFQPVQGLDIAEVARYSSSKGIKLLLWTNYISIRDDIDSVFANLVSKGVSGVKVDFLRREDQEMVEFVNTLVRKAARYKLVLDLHGTYKPTGLSRTYPNLLTVESVMGTEYNKWSMVPIKHNLVLPFTRNVSGPMDYAPAGFNTVQESEFRSQNSHTMTLGTCAHHLAMYVIYNSSLQMISDSPDYVFRSKALDFFKQLPSEWDEVVPICGEIGRYIAVAKRKGNVWHVGAMSAEQNIDLTLSLNFLNVPGPYMMKTYGDVPDDNKSLQVEQTVAFPTDTLRIKLSAGGGFVASFRPQRPS